jgi:hypothetical protein
MSGNESSAIGSLRAINSAEAAYSSSAGGGGYAISLVVLSTPCPGSQQGFISPDLSLDPSVKSGYTITLADSTIGTPADVTTDCSGTTVSRTGYYATALPVNVGTTGTRGFSTAAHGTLYFVPDATGGAPAETGGTPLQ